MSDEDEGLPLADAIRAYGDPQLWAAYEEAERAAAGKRRAGYFVIGDVPIVGPDVAARIDRNNALVAARDRAWLGILQAFLGRLLSGELIATGCEAPASLDRQRRSIPAKTWTKLRIDLRRSSARWCEMELREILVRPAADPGYDPAAAEAPQEDETASLRSNQERPGPRTFIPEAEEEMRALASCGALTGSLKADSHAIAGRVAARFLGQKVCDPKTIRNRLNKLYRILYREQCAQINSGDF